MHTYMEKIEGVLILVTPNGKAMVMQSGFTQSIQFIPLEKIVQFQNIAYWLFNSAEVD